MKRTMILVGILLSCLFPIVGQAQETDTAHSKTGIGFSQEREPTPNPREDGPKDAVPTKVLPENAVYASGKSYPKTGELRSHWSQLMGTLCVSLWFWLFLFTRLREEEDDDEAARF